MRSIVEGTLQSCFFRDPALKKMPVLLENQQPVFFAHGEAEGVAATATR